MNAVCPTIYEMIAFSFGEADSCCFWNLNLPQTHFQWGYCCIKTDTLCALFKYQVPTTELSSQFHASFQFQCSSFSIRVWPSEGNTTAWHQNRQIIKHWKHAWIQRWVLKWPERSPVIFFNHHLSFVIFLEHRGRHDCCLFHSVYIHRLCIDIYDQAFLDAVLDKASTHNSSHLYQ